MKKLALVPWILAGMVLLFALGLFAGWKAFSPHPTATTTVTSQTILTALHQRGFLVTETYVFDTPVTIQHSTGSALKDFFLGQTIEARGTMEVNMGIDLAQVKQEDITIDQQAGTVTIKLPGASLFDTRLVGPIDLKNKQGILKQLLDSDDGYNDAQAALTKAAEDAASKPELVQEANDSATEDVRQLLQYVTRGEVIQVEKK